MDQAGTPVITVLNSFSKKEKKKEEKGKKENKNSTARVKLKGRTKWIRLSLIKASLKSQRFKRSLWRTLPTCELSSLFHATLELHPCSLYALMQLGILKQAFTWKGQLREGTMLKRWQKMKGASKQPGVLSFTYLSVGIFLCFNLYRQTCCVYIHIKSNPVLYTKCITTCFSDKIY